MLAITDRDIGSDFARTFIQASREDAIVVELNEPKAPIGFRGAGDREKNDGEHQHSEHGDSEDSSGQRPTQAAVIIPRLGLLHAFR